MVVVNVGAQEKKEAKKEEVKVQKTEKQACDPKECSKTCQEKHARGECKDHDPGKYNHENCEKHDCDLKPGSKECLEKHAKGECKGHKPGECCQTDQAKKQNENEKKK